MKPPRLAPAPLPEGMERIGVTEQDLEREAAMPRAAAEMLIQTANALTTGAPVSEEQLRLAAAHYQTLAELALKSGPRFSNAARDAVNLQNVCVRRLRETRDEARQRAIRHAELTDGLVEMRIE